jgi:hypothetical protein
MAVHQPIAAVMLFILWLVAAAKYSKVLKQYLCQQYNIILNQYVALL